MTGRTVIVTGAESGIGRACATALTALRDRIAILYHSDADAARASAQAAGPAMIVQCDVVDEASVDAAFGTVEAAWGPAAVLVNSAGVNMRARAARWWARQGLNL